MAKKILVPLADGFEEIEFVSICDILRRAKCEVIVAALGENLLVSGAHEIKIKADCTLQSVDVSGLDAIVLAGGWGGMLNLKVNAQILDIIRALHSSNRLVAAICASPIVLNEAGIFDESSKFACYPGCEAGLKGTRVPKAVQVGLGENLTQSEDFGVNLAKKNENLGENFTQKSENLSVNFLQNGENLSSNAGKKGLIITSAGPATAALFALEIVAHLCGENTRKALADELLVGLVKN